MASTGRRGKGKRDLYQEVTNWVLEQFEKDIPRWRKPWTPTDFPCSYPFNVTTGKPYRGMNNAILEMVALDHADPRFLTYKQAKDIGAQVRKGEKSSTVMFYKPVEKTVKNNDGEDEKESFLVAKAYNVFNAKQVEGLPDLPVREKTWDDNEIADLFIDHMVNEFDTDLEYGTERACHFKGTNKVRMPHRGDFEDPSEFYATMFHEMVHRTSPLTGRDDLNLSYEAEELVAELGAMFLSRQLNMPFNPNVDNNSASYLKGWSLKAAIKDDKNLIFKASRLAQEAVEHVLTPDFRKKINEIQKVDEALNAAVQQACSQDSSEEVEINSDAIERIRSETKEEAGTAISQGVK